MRIFESSLFETLTSNFLIYNTSWEDPLVDKELLKLNSGSNLFMITSAGDNALSYLLESPKAIHAVDSNYRQNALLDLKMALIKAGEPENLFALFLTGRSSRYLEIYESVKGQLHPQSLEFWNRHIHWFKADGPGFYFSGLTGRFAQIIHFLLRQKECTDLAIQLMDSDTREEREQIYAKIENRLWNGRLKSVWQWDGILQLAGIPKAQKYAIGDLNQFMRKVFYQLFVEHSGRNNYFWRLYLQGHYSSEYQPEYLMEQHSDYLIKHIDRLSFKNESMIESLRDHKKSYSHFVLLDHMDWMATQKPGLLLEEWRQILEHAEPGAKVLFRSAYQTLDFLPSVVRDRLNVQIIDPKLLQNDRVGTYPSTYLAYLDV